MCIGRYTCQNNDREAGYPMPGEMHLRIWDVEHGACAMIQHVNTGIAGRLAMIDSGCAAEWRPSTHIRHTLGRTRLDYLFITNADQDHMSDLEGLWDEGVYVATLHRNKSYTGAQLRSIKEESGPLTDDAERYVAICDQYNVPATEPFDGYMGGIKATTFWNPYPMFDETNDLSMAVFLEYNGFTALFPGDLEKAGWRALLQRQDFVEKLATTEIFVASHHGRESGFCPEVFDYCTPWAVVISDKPIEHETQQMVPDYRAVVRDEGVYVRTTAKRRHVLTTRRDGTIHFTVAADGSFHIDTEYRG
jgi:beta-lactamase superfamily II metal-dependent hydrolase